MKLFGKKEIENGQGVIEISYNAPSSVQVNQLPNKEALETVSQKKFLQQFESLNKSIVSYKHFLKMCWVLATNFRENFEGRSADCSAKRQRVH